MKNGKFVVLCVDDDPDILESLRVVLESNGYTMLGSSNGDDAVRQFKENKPDLIMLDLMMDSIDAGMALARQLKALGNTAPVYMLSSLGDELNRTTDTTDLGFRGVFQKPIQPQVLLNTLKCDLKA